MKRQSYPEKRPGELFQITRNGSTYSRGTILKLFYNDNTCCPAFKVYNDPDSCEFYFYWEYLEPYVENNQHSGLSLNIL